MTGKKDNTTRVEHVVPIAGDYIHQGRGWDPKWQLLKNGGSHADAEREGLLIEFNGGRYPFDDTKKGVQQKAVVEFICDRERTGLEGDEEDKRPKEDGDEKDRRRRDEDGGEEKKDRSLKYVSYKNEGEPAVGVLRLDWRTKYACEDAVNNPDLHPKGGWGFFTWFLIM